MRPQDLEKEIARAQAHARKTLAAKSKTYDHPIGQQKVPERDQVFDWVNSGPDYWPKTVSSAISQAQSEGKTLGDAIIAVLQHDARMKMLSEQGDDDANG